MENSLFLVIDIQSTQNQQGLKDVNTAIDQTEPTDIYKATTQEKHNTHNTHGTLAKIDYTCGQKGATCETWQVQGGLYDNVTNSKDCLELKLIN